jgi:hypothetical protein
MTLALWTLSAALGASARITDSTTLPRKFAQIGYVLALPVGPAIPMGDHP